MSNVVLLPENLGPVGSKLYNLLLPLGFREDFLLTIGPPPGHSRPAQWLIDNWKIVAFSYEEQTGDSLHWAFVGTDDWSNTRMRMCGSGHILFPAQHMPRQYDLLRALWEERGDWVARSHTWKRNYHRSKVGYWCQHLDTGDYIVEFSKSVPLHDYL